MLKNVILNGMKVILKEKGYKKKDSSFYKNSNNAIVLINLQKSQWGENFYINIGILFKELENNIEYPKENQSHIHFRIEDFGNHGEIVSKIIDTRTGKIDVDCFNKEFNLAFPEVDSYLDKLTDRKSLINTIKEENKLIYHITKKTKDWLKIEE